MKINRLIKLSHFYIVVFLLLSLKSFGQFTGDADSLMNALIAKQLSINQKKLSMPGYRVQIYVGGKRDQANEIKTTFNTSFPDIAAYITYQQPNFKVRVGDCKTRIEAIKILDQVKPNFDVAFIVKDDVKLPEVK